MNQNIEFIISILPSLAGYFSETVSGEPSGNKQFEDIIRRSPPNMLLWSEIFKLSFRIFEDETELDKENNFEDSTDYENQWNDFLELRSNINEWFPEVHNQWVEEKCWISHPDTHGPDESLAYLVCGTFHRKFKDYLWSDKYKNEIKEMYQQFGTK